MIDILLTPYMDLSGFESLSRAFPSVESGGGTGPDSHGDRKTLCNKRNVN